MLISGIRKWSSRQACTPVSDVGSCFYGGMDSNPDHANPDQVLRDLAASQHGIVTFQQALAAGLSPQGLNRRVSNGSLVRLHPEIYALHGVAPSPRQTLLGAVLWGGPGSGASHRAAAWLWDLDGSSPTLEITTSRRLESSKVIAHRRPPIATRDLKSAQGIPVTSIDLTLFDLAAVLDEDALEDSLDSALRKRLTSVNRLRLRLRETTRRKGIQSLRSLVDERASNGGPSASRFETRLNRLLSSHGLPALRQFTVWDGGEFVARVDFSYPHARVIVEADSYRWHSSKRAWQRDIERRNQLTSLGWQIIHVTWDDLTRRPNETLDRIRASLQPRLFA